MDIVIEYTGEGAPCPECGKNCQKYDLRKIHIWRHLDTMQFTTYHHCEPPRVRCPEHGVKSIDIPWTGPARQSPDTVYRHGRKTVSP
ncbi:transposase family protein [Microbulbifer thermotolerans]|uniref:transposase family protein n=1 Tax=Microbulbifer thermotolerans TaxID=252514 RepID=UPI00396A3BCC